MHSGWTQYSADTVIEWCRQNNFQPTTDITITRLECSSSEVLNSMFEELGHTIDQEHGLKSLAIEWLGDENTLQEWPLSQLSLKCHHLESRPIFLRVHMHSMDDCM